MIIFVLALLVMIGSLVVNLLPSLKTNKVLVMSVLAILMIMINFINQVDILVSPPQLLVKLDSSLESHGKKQFTKLTLKPKSQKSELSYLTKQLESLKQSITESSQLNQKQKEITFQYLSTFPLPSHLKPLTKSQFHFIQQLKTKIISGQDWIVYIQGIEKIRFELLMAFYLKEINEKSSGYHHSFEKVLSVGVYEETMAGEKGFKFTEKLGDKNYHYVIVFDQPSEKLLKFLFEQYLSQKNITVIFLDLNQKVIIFPISQFIEHIHYPQSTYLQSITDHVLESISTKENKKELREMTKRMEKELQLCQKYVEMDFEMFLKVLINHKHKTLTKICYEEIPQSLEEQIECLRNLVTNEDEQIPFFKAKRCWKGKNYPSGVIKTYQDKIKLKKQYFWSNKVTPTDFGLQVVTKKCSNQL